MIYLSGVELDEEITQHENFSFVYQIMLNSIDPLQCFLVQSSRSNRLNVKAEFNPVENREVWPSKFHENVFQ